MANRRFRGYGGKVQVHVLSVCWQRLRLGAYLLALNSEHRANEIHGLSLSNVPHAEHHKSHLNPSLTRLSEGVVRNDVFRGLLVLGMWSNAFA